MRLSYIFNVFPKKYTCEICGEKLLKKFFANDSRKKYVYVVKLKKMKRKRKKNLTRIFNTYIRIAKNYL